MFIIQRTLTGKKIDVKERDPFIWQTIPHLNRQYREYRAKCFPILDHII